ncbi:MAG: nicotinate-nucleotide adenylyltransferase, partial [Cognaticolwellia sp.]
IHLGHIIPAQETALWLGAEQLHLIPAHIPPHKTGTHASAKQRAEMVALACEPDKGVLLDSRELDRDSPSYTIDTLREITKAQPKATLYFIMGMDSLLTFTKWWHWQEILTLCNLVVNIRPGYQHHELESTLEPELAKRLIYRLTKLQREKVGQILLHESTPLDISSTKVRENIKNSISYSEYLPKPVYHYIKQNKLYR